MDNISKRRGDNYEWVFKQGYADFDNQSECEDFIRWAIDEIVILRKSNKELVDIIYGE